jgi:colicin import membrane protein
VDIALEKEKLRQKEREKERDKKEQLEREKLEREKKEKQERQERQERDKREADKKRADEQKRQDELKKKERKEAELAAKFRDDQLKRIDKQLGLEGASGGTNASGNALKSTGPNVSYWQRIANMIINLANFDYSNVPGNPLICVQITTAPNGTITNKKITKKSENDRWNNEVLRAIEKLDSIPRDVDGTIPLLPPGDGLCFLPKPI